MLLSKYNVITSYGDVGFRQYGRKFVETFFKFWPKEVQLFIYHEGRSFLTEGQLTQFNLLKEVEPCMDFLKRHAKNNIAKGMQQVAGQRWKNKCVEEGYNFRFDAFKFCRKPFVIQDLLIRIARENALEHEKNPVRLFWVDADVVTYNKITLDVLDSLLPQGYPISYLGRDNCYSECGFVGYDITNADARTLINGVANLYATDNVFNIREWHDSYIFDHVKNSLKIEGFNLSQGGRGHVFNNSVLGMYMDHLKGDRKEKGRSEMPHDEDILKHWQRYR